MATFYWTSSYLRTWACLADKPPSRTSCFFLFQAEDGIRGFHVTGVQTCALPISGGSGGSRSSSRPGTLGTKPENAASAAGRGRPFASPSEYVITAPCEKPPSTVRSGSNPSPSSHSVSCANVDQNVSGSGSPSR